MRTLEEIRARIDEIDAQLLPLFPGSAGCDAAQLGRRTDQRAGLLRLLENLIKVAVLHAEVIDHIYLEGGDAVVHSLLHGVQQTVGKVRDAHMQGVVHGGTVFIGLGLSALGGLQQRLALGLAAVVEDRRCAAAGGCPGAGEEIVGGNRPAEGEGQVRMGVNGAGEHQFAGSIHHMVAGNAREILGNGDNLAVLNAQVRPEHLLFRHDGAVPNQ